MLAAIYTVTIPRISYYVGVGDDDSIKKIYSSIVSKILLILIPCSMGMIAISREVILFMGGQEYQDGIVTLNILSVSLVGAILGGLVTYCLNIPTGREKINMKATTLSAIINIILNLFMIPVFKQNGAAVTTLISEFFVFIFCCINNKDLKKYIEFKIIRNNIVHAIIGGISILLISYLMHRILINIYLLISSIIGLSIVCYSFELIILKNDVAITVLNKVRKRNG